MTKFIVMLSYFRCLPLDRSVLSRGDLGVLSRGDFGVLSRGDFGDFFVVLFLSLSFRGVVEELLDCFFELSLEVAIVVVVDDFGDSVRGVVLLEFFLVPD